jgi:hypothetical protein
LHRVPHKELIITPVGNPRRDYAEAWRPSGRDPLSARFAEIPVLFTSGYSAESDVIPDRALGAISSEAVQQDDAR